MRACSGSHTGAVQTPRCHAELFVGGDVARQGRAGHKHEQGLLLQAVQAERPPRHGVHDAQQVRLADVGDPQK